MEDEKLIDLVRKYEFIYNLKHPKYMDTIRKEIAWKEIADQLQIPAAACKQRWQCLRDAYRRALNKKKGRIEQGAKNVKQWTYENEMSFVAPFFVERKTYESTEIMSDDEGSNNGDENYAIDPNVSEKLTTDIGVDDIAADDVSDFKSTINIGISSDIKNNIVQNYKAQQTKNDIKTKAVKRKAVEPELPTYATLITKLLDSINKCEPSRGQDELDRFFLNISDTVKKFTPYQQALAKHKIFNLVSEMELQQLAPPNSSAYAYTLKESQEEFKYEKKEIE